MQIEKVKAKAKTAVVFSWIFIGLIIAGLVGLVASVIIAELNTANQALSRICWIVALASLALCFAAIGLTMLCFRLGQKYRGEEADLRELAHSAHSYFIGEHLLATFGEGAMTVHAEQGQEVKYVRTKIPYSEIKVFSVTVRRSAKAKGERNILIEIPSRYLKNATEPTSKTTLLTLVEKPRFYETAQAFSLPVQETDDKSPLRSLKKLYKVTLRDSADSKSKTVSLIVGIAMVIAGIAVAFFGGSSAPLGVVLACFGVFIAVRAIIALARGNGSLVISEDGVLWQEKNVFENSYLRWTEIERIKRIKYEGQAFVSFVCAYGAYYYPDVDGLYDYLKENFAEKVGG